jgi:PAS domain S-box-containing protein
MRDEAPARRSVDAAYARARARRVSAQAPAAFAVLAACAALATVLEIVRFPERRIAMLAADGVFALAIAVGSWSARRRPAAMPTVLTLGAIVTGVVQSAYHAAVGAPPAVCVWTITAVLSTTAVLLPWGWRRQLVVALATFAAYPLMLRSPGTLDVLGWAAGAAYLLWVVLLSTVAAGLIDGYLRRDFTLASRLSDREARLQSYFDLALVGTAVLSPGGDWVEVNDELCRLLGQKRERLLRVAWVDLVHADDRVRERALLAAARAGDDAPSAQLRLVRADGDVIDATVSMRRLPVVGDGDGPILVLVHDVTERARLEARLRRAKEVAEDRQRSLSAFLALVSHEIRNPMTVVVGMTDVVLAGELSAEQRHRLQKAKEATAAVVRLLNDLLDISRLDAGRLAFRPRAIELRSWLDEVLAPLEWLGEQRGLRVVSGVAADVPQHVVGDPQRLRQVVVNLVDNAIKFTTGTLVSVTVAAESPDWLRLTVADAGPGIPSDAHDRIFEAFAQATGDAPGRGSGLGLAICRRLATHMGGRIWVESGANAGTSFHVTLPVVLRVEEPSASAGAA